MLTLQEKKQRATIMLIISAYTILKGYQARQLSRTKLPTIKRDEERQMMLYRMYMESDSHCRDQLGMTRAVFKRLCSRLEDHGLVERRSVKVKEQVAIFLHILRRDKSNRSGKFKFIRSGQTISRYFHTVLRAVISMYKEVVKQAKHTNSPQDGGGEWWHKYFKDAVGAIDGTHIDATVPLDAQARYRNRKKRITQNVLVACTFDMKFTYVLAGWEGSAHDGRLLRDAVRRKDDRLKVPLGKYYLADAGFPNIPGFFTPFRGVNYHRSDSRGRRAKDEKELYNYRHSSLRNVVERTIGLLKKRFKYLRNPSFFDTKTQARAVLACCAIHNYLREEDPMDLCDQDSDDDEEEEEEEEEEDDDDDDEEDDDEDSNQDVDDDTNNEEERIIFSRSPAWIEKRDKLAKVMWNEYVPRH